MFVLISCLRVPSPQSNNHVPLVVLTAKLETFRSLVGLADEVPRKVSSMPVESLSETVEARRIRAVFLDTYLAGKSRASITKYLLDKETWDSPPLQFMKLCENTHLFKYFFDNFQSSLE